MKQKLFVILLLISLFVVNSGPAIAQGTKPPGSSDSTKSAFLTPVAGGQRTEVVAPADSSAELVTVPTLTNPNFELGRFVGWSESSTQGWPLVVNSSQMPFTPKSGSWAAWLGGDDNEISTLSQGNLTVINPTRLRFWYLLDSIDVCGFDFGYVKINSAIIQTWNLCESTNTGGWRALDLDLSAYSGQTVTITFQVQTDSSLDSSVYIDALSLYSTFVDVPFNHQFWGQIEAFYNAGITSGCSQNPKMYCPLANVNRGEMAVFIERALGNFSPTPNPTGMFTDLPYLGQPAFFQAFIEEFYNDGITTGCSPNPLKYCPQNNVTRGEMAVFVERALGNTNPTPDPNGMFADVPNLNQPPSFQAFIEQFYNDGITTGCAVSPLRFCPMNNVTRQEMAVFLVRAFGIPLP